VIQNPELLCHFILPAFAYLLGSVLTSSVLVSWGLIKDPATYGSKNPGATNVMRGSGKLMGAIILLGDGFKGWFIIWITAHFCAHHSSSLATLAQSASIPMMVVLGHCFSIYHNLKGGKGYATALGVILALNPMAFLITITIFAAVFFLTRYVSLASLLSILSAPLTAFIFTNHSINESIDLFIIAVIVLSMHQNNIKRLIKGTELKS
jgi:acyl phosphate:glycerol-3-phosphate acyltransferase